MTESPTDRRIMRPRSITFVGSECMLEIVRSYSTFQVPSGLPGFEACPWAEAAMVRQARRLSGRMLHCNFRFGCRMSEARKNPLTAALMNKISLAEKLSGFSEHYSPRTVETFNGHDIMVVKLLGPFTWHSHPD